MKPARILITLTTALLALTAAHAETTGSPDAWERFNDWKIGDVLFSSLHIHGVGGFSSGDPEKLATGGHDPVRKSFSAQAIEPGLSLRTGYFEAFTNYLFYQDVDGDWDGELEELFGKIINIPGGFELKGGQYLARFGAINDKHIHAWDFVDSEMPVSRFLGDDGLIIQGAELSWTLPLNIDPGLTAVATLGFGNARAHEHDHGGHEEDHEDHEEALFEGEEGNLADDIFNARLMARYRFSDFHTITAGISYADGENGFGRGTRLFGVDAEYQWRENGLESGGRAFRWRNELIWRRVGAYDDGEHDHEEEEEEEDEEEDHMPVSGTYEEWGFYSTATYTWNQHLDTSLRVSWLEGVEDLGLDERFRISPAVSYWFDSQRRMGVRAQYNYDCFANGPVEHTLWFQFNIALGSNVEVR